MPNNVGGADVCFKCLTSITIKAGKHFPSLLPGMKDCDFCSRGVMREPVEHLRGLCLPLEYVLHRGLSLGQIIHDVWKPIAS